MSTSAGSLQDKANMEEIINLARLLHQNGDKVLSASSKLSLSTTLLHELNKAFSLIVDDTEDLDSSFQVCNSSKIDIFRHLKFLHDFVQKTIGLKITQSSSDKVQPQSSTSKVCIDISKFRHLRYLELKKVSIESVKGIQGVRGQLESVICSGKQGVHKVAQLLAGCGADAGADFVWGSLKHLALPHNALEQLDTSLELAPWLQILDISHNLIRTANELDCLPNLKYVNLSYNKLESVPTFNKAALHSLQVLVLKNNYIEDISGLQALECLAELDLSYNFLAKHSTLWPLEKLSGLLWISLEGNPLSYHPKHRIRTIKYLHPCLTDSKFILDHIPLSKSEKLLIAENRTCPIRSVQPSIRENASALSNSIDSNITALSNNLSDSQEVMIDNQSLEISESIEKPVTRNKRKMNMKEAIISDEDHDRDEAKSRTSFLSACSLEASTDHLETKKQILALREKFGEDHWLSSHAGTFIQDIMGLQPALQAVLSSDTATETSTNVTAMSISHEQQNCLQEEKNVPEINAEAIVDEVTVDESNESNKENEQDTIYTLDSNDAQLNSTSMNDSEEEKGDLYLVQKKKNENEMEELFLVITPENIKERDSITGKVKYNWSINSVLSCVLGRGEPVTVDIIFDTARKDRQNRRYFVEVDDAKKIVATVSERMSQRTILLQIFKCMKCSTQFSQDPEYTLSVSSVSGIKPIKCPTCESTLVIQTDELSTLDAECKDIKQSEQQASKNDNSRNLTNTNLQHCDSVSSIGSATSLEESRESTPSACALTKKYESDIEILSNPSQSSIEVLDEATRTTLTPNRKRSSEERRTAIAPSLLTIPDTTPIMTGLTESSSSGSLTDSICTAYENRIVRKSESSDKSQQNDLDKEMMFTPVTNLTSMLGGLLQSIKIGGSKTLVSKTEEKSNIFGSNVQYSYTDFSSIDHRVKLHIVLNIFEHENEELVLLLRADILMHSSKEVFPGCVVISTSKVYILRIGGLEGEDPQRWLYKEISWTMDRLRTFSPLPFKQGVLMELQQPSKISEDHSSIMVLCVLQDFQRTSNFLFYITDLPLLASCEIEFSVPEHCSILMHNLLKTAKNHEPGDAVRLLALFSAATLKYQNCTTKLTFSGLIITASILVILQDNMQWLLPCNSEIPTILKEQTMSNLIEIEHCGTSLTLNFLDENIGSEESWTLEFSSTGAVEAVISSIQPPWEELFSIPLQVSKAPHNTKEM